MRLFYGNLKEMEHNDQNRYRANNGPLEYTNWKREQNQEKKKHVK